jgi:heme-degrading monooxygenase HmoA
MYGAVSPRGGSAVLHSTSVETNAARFRLFSPPDARTIMAVPPALYLTRTTRMILEIAQIDVKPGMEAEFEAGVKKAAPIFKRAKGCKFMTLQRSHEMPQRYRLFVQWETLENHTKDFRESPDFHEWRKLVGHCFSTPPNVEHVIEVMRGF